MLRPISRRLPIGSAIRSVPSSAVKRPFVVPCRRYAEKKPPSNNDASQPPISDYIASQPPPNPETPPDRMPHQTEEDIATEKILGDKPSSGDGLPAEGVPIEDV